MVAAQLMTAYILGLLLPFGLQQMDLSPGLFDLTFRKPNDQIIHARASDKWEKVFDYRAPSAGGFAVREVVLMGCGTSFRLGSERPLRLVVTVSTKPGEARYTLALAGTLDCKLERVEFPRLTLPAGWAVEAEGADLLSAPRESGRVFLVSWPLAKDRARASPWCSGEVIVREGGD